MKKRIIEIRAGVIHGRIQIIFDDGYSFCAGPRIIGELGIHVGQEVDTDVLNKQNLEYDYESCYEAALHFLDYRPRSESELKRHLLGKRGFLVESVDRCLDKLKEIKLIDDNAFAQLWMHDRLSHRPRSRLMIKQELLQKGVRKEIANSVTDGIDDADSAYKAGLKKAQSLCNLEYREFYKRLAAFLNRRGYGGDDIHGAVTRLWQTICSE